jgi:hypothetical protein
MNKIRIFFPGFLRWECLRRRSQPLCEPAAGPSPLRRRPPIEEMVFFVGSMFAELQFSGVISWYLLWWNDPFSAGVMFRAYQWRKKRKYPEQASWQECVWGQIWNDTFISSQDGVPIETGSYSKLKRFVLMRMFCTSWKQLLQTDERFFTMCTLFPVLSLLTGSFTAILRKIPVLRLLHTHGKSSPHGLSIWFRFCSWHPMESDFLMLPN